MRLTSAIYSLVFASLSLVACGGGGAAPMPDGPPSNPTPDGMPLPATCSNHVQDGDETDVDCGGGCGATCAAWAKCDWHDDCADGGVCAELPVADHETATRTCRPVVAACTPGACGDGICQTMQTNLDPASPDQVVVAYCEQRAALGDVCRSSNDKDVHTCVDGAACAADPSDVFTDRCVAMNTAAGAACSAQTCVAGYYCDHSGFGSEPTCQPIKGQGASCLNSEECATGLHCDDFRGVCEPRAPIGGDCYFGEDGRNECSPGLSCQFATGLACTTWGDCGSQMDCCATSSGSECRAFNGQNHCEPPSGACAVPPPLS